MNLCGTDRGAALALRGAARIVLVVAIASIATLAKASVFYKFNVVAETGVAPFNFTSLGIGPSVNNKGKVAYVGVVTNQADESVYLWSPLGATSSDIGLPHPQNRTYGANGTGAVHVNGTDQVVAFTHTFAPSNIYEVRIFGTSAPSGNSIMVRGSSAGAVNYDLLYPNPWINNTLALEDRSSAIGTGNKDGVCNSGEVCVPQTVFNAPRLPTKFVGTVVRNPSDAADAGIQHEFGVDNTINSRPMIADDGRIVVRGNLPTDPIILFNNYALSSQTQIANASMGFTALGNAPGITPDGKVVAFAGNRGAGDGIFLSIEVSPGVRRLVRIVGENVTFQKEELGFDASGKKLFIQAIDLDSRVGIVYTPDADGNPNGSVVVSFVGTPNAASRINPANGRPFLFSNQQGLWTIRIDLTAALYNNVCLTRDAGSGLPPTQGDDMQQNANGVFFVNGGANGVCETANTDGAETLFSRTSPIPVVQINDIVRSPNATYTVASLGIANHAPHDPIAAADTDDALIARNARLGDHRVVFWAADASNNQFIVRAEHLDSDQDGLLDHWETTGIDLTGTGTIDLDLAAMGANPFQRDLFLQLDWTADRGPPLNVLRRHPPAPGVLRQLAQFYAGAPALPNGIPAGITLHVDAGPGLDGAQQFFSRNMGIGPVRGGKIVDPVPMDILYFGKPGSVSLTGVHVADFDSVKAANFWAFNHGAREFAFRYLVLADHSEAAPSKTSPFTGTATSATPVSIVDTNQRFSVDVLGGVVKITGGTGAGQVRQILSARLTSLTVTPGWNVTPDTSSTYIVLNGAGGESHPGERYDGSFSAGNNIAITLGGFNLFTPGGYQGAFIDEWQTLAHETGHILSLKHGGVDHDNYKAAYHSLMNYAYQLCAAGQQAKDGNGNVLAGAAVCPVNDFSRANDAVFYDWGHLDMKGALNFARVGQALGSEASPTQQPFPSKHVAVNQNQIESRFGTRDTQAPSVTINSPANGVVVSQGSPITVTLTATDNVAVVKAEAFFDRNGDGTVADPAEVFAASATGTNTYNVTIPAISGPNTARYLTMMAYDPTGNAGSSTIVINVGGVPPPVLAPNVVNQPLENAAATIATLNLVVGTVTQQASPSVPDGSIISQSPPAGQSVPVLTAIDVVLSSGNTTVIVPNGVGMTQAAATTAMTGAGLIVGAVTSLPSSTIPSGSVISQLPLANAQVGAGTSVTLSVSTGPGNVTVPDVTNQASVDATNAITSVGLAIGTLTHQTSITVAAGAVISQSPIGGASIAAGSAVNLTISSGDGTVPVPSVIGRTQADATTVITNNGLVVGTVTTQPSPTVPAGSVVSQSPSAGVGLAFGGSVDLTLSSGPPPAQRTFVSPNGNDANLCGATTPCRSFNRAIARTASSGEIIVLASAGYGPATIDKPLTISASEGVYAGVSVSSGTGMVVNAASGRVTLSGLAINGLGGTIGVDFQTGDALYIDDCVIAGFSSAGINAQGSAAAQIYVRNSAVRDNTFGIAAGLSTGAALSLNVESAQIERNGIGVAIIGHGALGAIRNSRFSANTTGLAVSPTAAGSSALFDVRKTSLANNGAAIRVGGTAGTTSQLSLASSLIAASTTVSIEVGTGGTAWVADTTITRNALGVSPISGGLAISFGNNRLLNNATDGAFSSSLSLQ